VVRLFHKSKVLFLCIRQAGIPFNKRAQNQQKETSDIPTELMGTREGGGASLQVRRDWGAPVMKVCE